MKNPYILKVIFIASILLHISSSGLMAQRKMENLDRGLVAVQTGNGVFLSWRVFGTDPKSIAFNIYRNGTKVNSSPITGATNMVDGAGSASASYTVRPVVGGTEQTAGGSATVWGSQVRTITLSNRPSSSHTPNDINVGDLDGDGKYDLVVKWYPNNAKDNAHDGVTSSTYLAAYKMDGTFMWIIDLGRNIRSGAHYTQHLVGDYDSDGKAEVACKTAPGTRDGSNAYLSTGPAASDNNTANYVNGAGRILTGPEYLTIFNGQTGREMATVNYPVPRGNVSSWGDNVMNRGDRFNATNAYLDGVKPSMIFQRGYYTRLTLSAMDWDGQRLSTRWIFDSNNSGSTGARGQGNHSVMAADIDGDGFDEILPGACAIDHNGRFMWATGFGHGDANHVGDFDPASPGLEIFLANEQKGSQPDHYMVRARDGRVLWRHGSGHDNGRGMVGDIDARHAGQEAWSNSVDGTYRANGTRFTTEKPSSTNFRIYWDGDLQDEIPLGNSDNTNNRIGKWNGNGTSSILTLTGRTCNGTKATPNIVADLIGDWREEIILHDGGSRLYLHTTTIPTQHKLYTLMHDPAYRNAISYQQSSYNQPPHLGFFLGAGVAQAPTPNIVLVGQNPSNQLPTVTLTAPANNASYAAPASITISANASDADGSISSVSFYHGTTLLGTDATAPYSFNWTNVAEGTYSITAVATDNAGGTTTSSAVAVTVNSTTSLKLQGEAACSADGIQNENTNAGFNGTGYVNLDNAIGTKATWAVSASAQENVSLTIRFANGTTANRTMSVSVNGVTQVASVSFPGTGAWTTWNTAVVPITLSQGKNFVTLSSLTADGAPNIDELTFGSENVTAASCVANQAPSVSLVVPSANYMAPASITLSANASDTDGTVSSVSFYHGTTLIGTDPTAPYSFNWTNVAEGTYSITAVATDNEGLSTTSSAVTVNVSPAPAEFKIQGESACSADGIMNENTNAGFNGTGYVNLDNATGTKASWVVSASAQENVSLTIRFANGTTADRTMSVSVNGVTQIASVSFPGTGAWTTWNTAVVQLTVSQGKNIVTLTSLTANGAPNIDDLTFGSENLITASCTNQAPTVSVTSPLNGTESDAPVTINITAAASDSDGSVNKVEFFNGSTLLGSDASSPYAFNWTNVAEGTYSITAKATDNEGAVTTSSPVSITVKSVVQDTLIGVDCTSPNATISFELNASKRNGAIAYTWWSTGYTQSMKPVSGSEYKVDIQTGAHYTGGDICVGVTYNVAPYYVYYCKKVTVCATSQSIVAEEEVLVGPNPSDNTFRLTALDNIGSISVSNTHGIEVFSHGQVTQGNQVEFGSEFNTGVYFVTVVYSSGKVEVIRLQKV